MIETLFSYPRVRKRHREGPLAQERITYIKSLAALGVASGTLLRRARYSLCVAKEIDKWSPAHRFTASELDVLATSWAAERVASGRAGSLRWPHEHFRFVAVEFLTVIGRLAEEPSPPPRGRSGNESQGSRNLRSHSAGPGKL